MKKYFLIVILALLIFPTNSFAGPIPWKTIYPGELRIKNDPTNCIAGFYAKSIPENTSSYWYFNIPNQWASGVGYIALLDTNKDGYHQPIPMPGIPQDKYSLEFGYNGWNYAWVKNIGWGTIAYKFLVRKPCL